MNTNSAFVTALYNTSPFSRIGGRGWSFEFWVPCLRNLLSLEIPLVIYTHDDQIGKLKKFLEDQKNNNLYKIEYELINYDLDKYRHSDQIYSIKEQHNRIDSNGLVEGLSPNTNDRNNHLCLSKIDWVQEQSQLNPFSKEKYYWIDIGLFHHGLFPDSLGGMERFIRVDESKYWPTNHTTMFTPDLGYQLDIINDDKFLCIKHEEYPISSDHAQSIFRYGQVEDKVPGYIIGGLFGGDKASVNYICEYSNKLIDTLFENNVLSLEELILSAAWGKYPNICKPLSFEIWSHDCPAGPEIDRAGPYNTGNGKSFYKIFYNDMLENNKKIMDREN